MHVGEEVRFDFVLQGLFRRFVPPLGLADYCIATVGSERIEAEPNTVGHFQFTYTFDHVTPGEKVKVQATAYRQRGGRDFMRVRGRWLHSDSPYDLPDQKTAKDSIRFIVYEVPIELSMVQPPDDLEPESGVLRIRRTDGSITPVYIDRPHRPGFAITGPGADGHYRIRYTPKGAELNPIGTTDVEFVIYDTAGNPHYASTTLDTP
ncbi:MAG: hypothetical protein WBE26_20745 [Phycisphaerae bacterium]